MRIAIIALLTLAASSVWAQKVSIDQERIRIPYRELATTPVAEADRTFTIISDIKAGYDQHGFMQRIRVPGLTYVSDNAGLTVRYDFTGVIERQREIIKVPHKEKKDGEEFVRHTYQAKIVYEYGSSYSVFDRNGALLGETRTLKILSDSPYMTGCKEFFTKEFGKEKEAVNFLRINLDVILQDITNAILEDDARMIRVGLINRFGYPEDTKRIDIQYLDSKKHADYAENQKALKATLNGLALVGVDGGAEQAKESLLPCEDYYKNLIVKYNDTKDANHKKMRFMGYYNLGQIYLWTDRIGQAIDMFNMALTNDYETRDCKKMKEFAEEMQEDMKRNQMTTLHFEIPAAEYFGGGNYAPVYDDYNNNPNEVVDNTNITPRNMTDLDFQSATDSFEIVGYQVYFNKLYITFIVNRELLADPRCEIGYTLADSNLDNDDNPIHAMAYNKSFPLLKSLFEKGQYTVEVKNLNANKEYLVRTYISVDGKSTYGDIITIKTSRKID